MKKSVIISGLLCLVLSALGQQTAFIAPLESTFLDPETTAHLTGVLEEGIIKTGAFQVITTKDLELLLKAQSLMISDLFKEELRAGELIPAKVMISAELMKSGEKVYLHLKETDLESGKILHSESLSTTLEEGTLEEALKLGAFQLSGKPLPPQSPDKSFQLTLNSIPSGGEIFVDGRSYGTTPLILNNLPGGHYFIEIKKENHYYATSLLLDRNQSLTEKLIPRFGSLLIETQPADGVTVRVDGTGYGEKKLISGLPAREVVILLRKSGFYWQGTIPIQPETTVKVAVPLKPTAALEVETEEDVKITLISDTGLKEFRGTHQLEDLLPGTYFLEARKQGFAPYSEKIELAAGETRKIIPGLNLTEAEYLRLTEKKEAVDEMKKLIASLELPEIYREQWVPELGKEAMFNSVLSMVPLGNIGLLNLQPLLPSIEKKEFRRSGVIQFSLGFLAQSFFFTSFLLDKENQKKGMFYTAAAFGALDLGYGLYLSSRWHPWSQEMRENKARYEELKRKLNVLEKE